MCWTNAALLSLQQCPECKGKRIYVDIDGRSYPSAGYEHKNNCKRMPAMDPRNLRKYGIRVTSAN